MHVAMLGPCSPDLVLDLLADRPAQQFEPRASGVPVAELARALVSLGHRVTLCALDPDVQATQSLSGFDFTLHRVPMRARPRERARDFFAIERKRLIEVLRSTSADVTHAHWTYEYELAAQNCARPHVTTIHDVPWSVLRAMPDAYRFARFAMAWRARPGIRRASAVSRYAADRWRHGMLYRRPITVIPNIVPIRLETASRSPAAEPVLLEVADGSPLKNTIRLLEAFSFVRRQYPRASLRLVGPGLGPDSPSARVASSMELDGVSFLGVLPHTEVREEMLRAWLLTHVSLNESFSLVTLEALACGLPVIVGRDSGGVVEVVDFGRAGQLVDAHDPVAIADAISSAISDGPPTQDPSISQWVGTRFSPQSVGQQYLDFYEGS